MKKINNFIKENLLLIVMAFLFLQPFLDIITFINLNFLNVTFTIGAVFRLMFLLFILYYLLFINKKDKKVWIYLGLLVIYGILFLTQYLNTGLLFLELKSLLKVFYFIIILIFFYLNKEKVKEINYKYFTYILVVYILFIISSNIMGNFSSYNFAKIIENGLLNSTNEIGAIISFLFLVYIYQMFKSKNKLKYIPILILYICAIFIVGTKVPVFAFIITMGIFIIKYFAEIISKHKIKEIIILSSSLIILTVFSIIIIPKTPFYNNIKVHMNYFNIASVKEIFTEYNNLDNIIFSERLTLSEDNINFYKDQSTYKKLLGSGSYEYKDNVIIERQTAEIDYIDVFVSYGVVGFLMFFAPIIFMLVNFILEFKNLKKEKILYFTLLFLIFSIALFSGHIFVAPAVSLYVAFFLIC